MVYQCQIFWLAGAPTLLQFGSAQLQCLCFTQSCKKKLWQPCSEFEWCLIAVLIHSSYMETSVFGRATELSEFQWCLNFWSQTAHNNLSTTVKLCGATFVVFSTEISTSCHYGVPVSDFWVAGAPMVVQFSSVQLQCLCFAQSCKKKLWQPCSEFQWCLHFWWQTAHTNVWTTEKLEGPKCAGFFL